jgi:hypothetical protein
VSPILGIYASQISGHLFAPSGAYDSIATATFTGSALSVTFSSIPSTYTHLQIRGLARTPSGNDQIDLRFNGDSGNNYSMHGLSGDGASTRQKVMAHKTVFLLLIRLLLMRMFIVYL